jgi:ATP-binding cassette, subfamily C, bacterial
VRRSIPLLFGMLVVGFLEGISVATLFPVLAIATNVSQEPSKLQSAIERGAAFLHLPLTLEFLCSFIAITVALKAILNLIVARQLGQAAAIMAQSLRERLLDALMRARWSYFTVQPVGRFIAAATSEANWASVAFRAALRVVEQLARTIIFCGIAILLGWKMALISIAMGVLMGLSLRSLSRAANVAGRARRQTMSHLVEEVSDTLAGFKPLKAMNRHGRLLEELKKDALQMRSAMNALILNQGLLNELPGLTQIVLFSIAAYIAIAFIGTPVDSIIVAGVVSFALASNVVRVRGVLAQLAQADTTYWDLQHTISEVEHAAERLHGTVTPSIDVGCEFRNVSFSYGRGPVLVEATFTIPARRITTLIGPSGIGKTTIADLLLGLYVPTSGSIRVDDVELESLDIVQWRSMVGYVSQDIILFNDTIFANVALGDASISEQQVIDAVSAAGLRSVVEELPEGMYSTIGERGFRLSGGQRQRLALARALIHKPKLLILDEATSALDPSTEEEIRDVIAARSTEMTVLAITHQPAWINRADLIYVIENGRVRRTSADEIKSTSFASA